MKQIPLWAGDLVTTLGTLAGLTLALQAPTNPPPLNLIIGLLAAGLLWYFPHCLAHRVAGLLLGIAFQHYVVAASSLIHLKLPVVSGLVARMPVLGLRTAKPAIRLTKPWARFIMHVSGALASMLLPLVPVITLYGSYPREGLLLLIIVAGNIGFTLYFSPKVGDIHRALTALRAGGSG
jgi:hypothetical protein